MAVETLSGSIDATISAPQVLANAGSSNTKGAYTELTASSGIAADGVLIHVQGGTANGDYLIDIATGAAASEVVKIANIGFHRQGLGIPTLVAPMLFPFAIPAGTRIAARQQTTNTTGVIRLAMYLLKKDTVGFHDCTSCVTYGANTTDSGGTQIDPGGTAHTKGAYSQITASTSADIKWLMAFIHNQNNATETTGNILLDIATGAGGAEVVKISNIHLCISADADIIVPIALGPWPIEIPSGTRIAARAQCGTNDGTDRLFDLTLIGFDGVASASGGAHFSASMM